MERNKFFLLFLSLVLILGVVESFDYDEKELESEEGLQGMYDRWRAHHKVTEKSPERFNVFKYNVENIHSINKMNRPYKLEVNKFATMTSHEFRTTYADSKIEHYNALAGINNLKTNNLNLPGPGCSNCPAAPSPPCPPAPGGGGCPACPGGGGCPACPGGGGCPACPGGGGCPACPGGGSCPACPGGGGNCPACPGGGGCPACPGGGGNCPACPGGGNCPPCPAAPANVPPRMDWREHNAVAPIKNQAQCGSCYAFAAVAAIESMNAIKTGQLVVLSEQQMVVTEGVVCGVYTYVHGAGGIALNESYPYHAKKGQCDKSKWSQKAVTVDEGKEVVPINDEQAMMEAVARNPVVVCMDTNHESFGYYKEGIYNGPCGNAGNHAMLNVGYDETPEGQKYWIIKNSWGHDWGEDGYIRVQRGGVPPEGMCGLYRCSDYPRKSPDTKNVGL